MARIEVLEFAALLEAMEAERRNQSLKKATRKPTHSAVGRVLAMAHRIGRDSGPLTDPKVLRAAVN